MSARVESAGWLAIALGLVVDVVAQFVAPHVVDPIVRVFQ